MKYTRPTDGLDKAARLNVEGANDNVPVATQPEREETLESRQARFVAALDGDLVPAPVYYPADTQPQPLVIIESPYGGDHERNVAYARVCLLDSLERGEAPIASHLLHTQVLNDDVPEERKSGIDAGLAWYRVADKCVVYTGRGITKGMREGMRRASACGVPIEMRDEAEGEVAA